MIHYGDCFAVVCELGTKIRRFNYQDREILCPFGVNGLIPTCNGYVLAPWPDRIGNGKYDFNDRYYYAPVNGYYPAPCSSTNYGYTYHYIWRSESLTGNAVTLSLRFPNLDGYPFGVTVTVTYGLGDNGATTTVNARNDNDEPAPWAPGLHPWLASGEQGITAAERDVDSAACHLQVKAASHVTVNEALIPAGTKPITDIYDLNNDPTFEGCAFDDAWVDVGRAVDDTTTTTFIRPDGIEVKIIDDEAIDAWQCYVTTGAPFAEHPYGITVEPITAPADAFHAGDHLVTLAPNGGYTTVVRYEVAQK